MKDITFSFLKTWAEVYDRDNTARTLHSALAKTDMADLAYIPARGAQLKGAFSVEVKTRGVTAQMKSGRCWLFAALNMLREVAADRLKVDSFELSQNYLSFYDKLEKANNVLEMVITHAEEPLNGQCMRYILTGMVDGGYWSEAADLIRKYGVVLKQVFPETYQSEHTARFLSIINRLLRKDAYELRRMIQQGKDPYSRKAEMMAEIYRAQCIAFGKPPATFDFAWRDKDNEYHCEKALTPLTFYEKYVAVDLSQYVPVINEPRDDRKLHAPVVFHSIENMTGKDMYALNLPQEELEDLCIRQLKSGEPVWFACDAGAYGARKEGVWDQESVQYEKLLGDFSVGLPKGISLEYHDTAATHAVLLTGVNLDVSGYPDRWKIENSWGKEAGDNGYFVCSETYFREYGYEAVIHKKHFSKEQLAMLIEEPIRIRPWDEE